MHAIKICYKLPKKNRRLENVLDEHAKFMKSTYVDGSEAKVLIHTYFTKASEPSDRMHPEQGATGNIVFAIIDTLSSIWQL